MGTMLTESENFLDYCRSVQNGSHPSPPINPVQAAIQELEYEVQDVVVGFETRLRRIKRNGERAFGGVAGDIDIEEQPEDETVSILPIEDDAHKPLVEGESPAIPPVVIGRKPEEIISALSRAAEQGAQVTSVSEDGFQDPEEVVERLVQEAVADEVVAASSAPTHRHNEL